MEGVMLSYERLERVFKAARTYICMQVPTRMHTHPGLERIHGLVVIA